MRTHAHEAGKQGNFWTLNLGVSDNVGATYEEMKGLWTETLENCHLETCPAKLIMIEVVYSIVSLSKETSTKKKYGARLAPWHIHLIVYSDGYSPEVIVDIIKDSWIKTANGRVDLVERVKDARIKAEQWGQGSHAIVASEAGQWSQDCYSRGRIAYMMWQAIHKEFVYFDKEGKSRNFAEMLRRLKLATKEQVAGRNEREKQWVIDDWTEWARNAKVALANIPVESNEYLRFADWGLRTLHDKKHNENTVSAVESKIQKIPDIKTPAQWQEVYDKLVKNLDTAGVRGLIEEGYEVIKKELEDKKPLLGVYDTHGTIEYYRDRVEIRPDYIDKEMLEHFKDIPEENQ